MLSVEKLYHRRNASELQHQLDRRMGGALFDEGVYAVLQNAETFAEFRVALIIVGGGEGGVYGPMDTHGVAGPLGAVSAGFLGQSDDDIDQNGARGFKKLAPALGVEAVCGDAFVREKTERQRVDFRQHGIASAGGGKAGAPFMAQQGLCQNAACGISGGQEQDCGGAGIHTFFTLPAKAASNHRHTVGGVDSCGQLIRELFSNRVA